MNYTFSFEKLEVWKNSKDLIKDIYKITKAFPSEEKYGLTSQINRCAVSVASNIAEGSSRTGKKDQAHFTQIAFGSMLELACQLIIAMELGYLSKNEYVPLREKIEEITNKLNSLRNSQLSRSSNKQIARSTDKRCINE